MDANAWSIVGEIAASAQTPYFLVTLSELELSPTATFPQPFARLNAGFF